MFFLQAKSWLKDRSFVLNAAVSGLSSDEDRTQNGADRTQNGATESRKRAKRPVRLPPWVQRSGRRIQVADAEDPNAVAFVQLMVNSGTKGVFAAKPTTPHLAKQIPGWDVSDPGAIKRVLHEGRPANLSDAWRGGVSRR